MNQKKVYSMLQALATELKPTASPVDKVKDNRQSSEKWFAENVNGGKIAQRGLKVVLPTKNGNKTYDAVKLENGKVAVYLSYGRLKYAW